MRRPQLEDHDRDDDGDHAVAEGFEPAFTHAGGSVSRRYAGTTRPIGQVDQRTQKSISFLDAPLRCPFCQSGVSARLLNGLRFCRRI